MYGQSPHILKDTTRVKPSNHGNCTNIMKYLQLITYLKSYYFKCYMLKTTNSII